MAYADANILVRYVVNDDEAMATCAGFRHAQAPRDCVLASCRLTNGTQILTFDKKLNNFIARKEAERKA